VFNALSAYTDNRRSNFAYPRENGIPIVSITFGPRARDTGADLRQTGIYFIPFSRVHLGFGTRFVVSNGRAETFCRDREGGWVDGAKNSTI